ncbi:uncharacterized protein G2W53_018478 [Senna tora]|uniref:Uncharacterized protein n=1 Tax=Senna tora TaxID=362788 RepID=A0A834WRL5_9FABA|nr:uncharacterized protein G2W53_018478 [Senna tora]
MGMKVGSPALETFQKWLNPINEDEGQLKYHSPVCGVGLMKTQKLDRASRAFLVHQRQHMFLELDTGLDRMSQSPLMIEASQMWIKPGRG